MTDATSQSGDDSISVPSVSESEVREIFYKDSGTLSSEIGTDRVVVPIGQLHATFWLLIVLSGIIFGFFLAKTLFSGEGSLEVALFGVLGTIVLAATLFSMSRKNVVIVKAKDRGK